MGIGWNLGGLSAISRTGSTLYHDEVVDGIDYDSNDNLILDGQRLIAINTSSTETEYRTELETYSKIVGYGTLGSGHQYFKVWTKSGQILEYGNTENSRIQALDYNDDQRSDVLTWYINSVEDRLGNFTEFSYFESNGHGQITTIKYSGNKRTLDNAEYTIYFDYDNRSDVILNYISGGSIKVTDILESIRIKKGETNLKTYSFFYNEVGLNARLISVKLYAGDITSPFLSETIFEWGDNDHQLVSETRSSTEPNVDHFFVDFDGDGKTDIVDAYWEGYSQGGYDVKRYYSWNYSHRVSNGFSAPMQFTNQITPFFAYLMAGDFNGDGKTDILETGQGYLQGCDIFEFDIPNQDWYWIGNSDSPTVDYQIFPGDFNGDGITDILTWNPDNPTGAWEILCFDGFSHWKHFDNPQIASFDSWDGTDAYYHGIKIADFNGDGKSDIAEFEKQTNTQIYADYIIYYSNGIRSCRK